VWGVGCGRCGGVGSLLTFDIPQTALVATLDTYDLLMYKSMHTLKKHFKLRSVSDRIADSKIKSWSRCSNRVT
jgi:hypothetical protein